MVRWAWIGGWLLIPSCLSATELHALATITLQRHPSLASAQHAVDAADADLEAARWQWYPTPSITFDQADTQSSLSLNRQTATARLQQPLWSGGRLTAGVERARAGVKARQADEALARLSLLTRVLEDWAGAMAAALKREAWAESRRRHDAFLARVQRRVEQGLSAQADITFARSRLEGVIAEHEQAEAQGRIALSRLERVSGLSLSLEDPAFQNVQPKFSAEDMGTLDGVITRANRVHPALERAAHLIEEREAELEVADAAYLPDVYARAEHIHGDITGSDQVLSVGVTAALGPGLSVSSAIKSARAKVLAEQAAREDVRLSIVEQLRNDWLLVQTSARRIEVLQASLQAASDIVEAWDRQFLAGRKTWHDLMNAARERAQIEAQLADAKAAQWLSVNRLILVSSGVDAWMSRQGGDA